MRRVLYANGISRTLGIYAPQGSGKTMFAKQLLSDIEECRGLKKSFDGENLWHRIARDNFSDGSTGVAAVGNLKVIHRDAGHDGDWVSELKSYLEHKQNRAIVLLDEADQAYFQLRLLDMSMNEFLQTTDPARLLKASAEKFAKQCRSHLGGALFILLSNRRDFLNNFSLAVNGQHENMMKVTDLPAADGPTKEKVVRTNTNRLNYFSYWYCINNARPVHKSAIYDALAGAGTFPAAFEAVDAAISDADQTRIGRPAIKNTLTLCVFHEDPDVSIIDTTFGPSAFIEFQSPECQTLLWTEKWASKIVGNDVGQSAAMLESEWNLRIILVGPPLIAALLNSASNKKQLKTVFDLLFDVSSPYATPATLSRIKSDRVAALAAVCLASVKIPPDFWGRGLNRSSSYETALKNIYPTYNTGNTQISGFRPDLLLSGYEACKVLSVVSNDPKKITQDIRRKAHFIEVTATKKASKASIANYLGDKLINYVRLMESD